MAPLAVTGCQLFVLSGQHGVPVLLELQERWVGSGRGDLPHWLVVVKADVLKLETPIEVRRLIAREEQCRG